MSIYYSVYYVLDKVRAPIVYVVNYALSINKMIKTGSPVSADR